MRGEFEQYRAMGKRIELLKRQLKDMECLTDTVKGSSAEWPYTEHPMTVTGRNAPEETEIIKEIDGLRQRRAKVRQIIKGVEDENIKLMLELKFTNPIKLSWEDVAVEMGEDVSGEAIRKRSDKFFDELSGFS